MFDKICELLSEQFDIDADLITPDTDLSDDLGIDKIDMIEFLLALEDEFNIVITQDDVANVTTVGDLADVVEELS